MDKHKAECCTDAPSESGCRNNYFDGKRLTTDAFRVEQRYLLERRYLMNRAIFGWGVVYGFGVSLESGRLRIEPGLALDECGRELVQVATRHLSVDDLIRIGEDDSHEHERACWMLSAHYAEQSTGPVPVEDSCHCQHKEWDRTCETVRYSLKRVPCSECCPPPRCELQCECPTEPCCDERKYGEEPECGCPESKYGRPESKYGRPEPESVQTQRPEHDHEHAAHGRGGCRCLCDYVTKKLNPNPEHCSVTEVDDPCGHVKVDLRHGVPLACIELVQREECWTLGSDIDVCGPRRLVKRNDVLFDLIRGCDLTRISKISWQDWHRREDPVRFEEFSAALSDDGDDEHKTVRDFKVTFSRPVRRNTVRPDCFVMRAMSGEREGGWWMVLRVPIVDVKMDPGDLVTSATIVVDKSWLSDAVKGSRTLFAGSDTWIEMEVRGDLITDCIGQKLDANGNGTPGGTFVSTFTVEASHPYATSTRVKGASS